MKNKQDPTDKQLIEAIDQLPDQDLAELRIAAIRYLKRLYNGEAVELTRHYNGEGTITKEISVTLKPDHISQLALIRLGLLNPTQAE